MEEDESFSTGMEGFPVGVGVEEEEDNDEEEEDDEGMVGVEDDDDEVIEGVLGSFDCSSLLFVFVSVCLLSTTSSSSLTFDSF